jgi:hypothetical protein
VVAGTPSGRHRGSAKLGPNHGNLMSVNFPDPVRILTGTLTSFLTTSHMSMVAAIRKDDGAAAVFSINELGWFGNEITGERIRDDDFIVGDRVTVAVEPESKPFTPSFQSGEMPVPDDTPFYFGLAILHNGEFVPLV